MQEDTGRDGERGIRTTTDELAEMPKLYEVDEDWDAFRDPKAGEDGALGGPREARAEQVRMRAARSRADDIIPPDLATGMAAVLVRTLLKRAPWSASSPSGALHRTVDPDTGLSTFSDPRVAQIVNERLRAVKTAVPRFFENITPELGSNLSVAQLLVLLKDPEFAAAFEGTDEQED